LTESNSWGIKGNYNNIDKSKTKQVDNKKLVNPIGINYIPKKLSDFKLGKNWKRINHKS